MAIHRPTAPARAGEHCRLASGQVRPVIAAIQATRAEPEPPRRRRPAAKPEAKYDELPITAKTLGHVLAGAFLAHSLSTSRLLAQLNLPISAKCFMSLIDDWQFDLANKLSDIGSLAAEDQAVSVSLCTASHALMQTETA